MLLLFEPCSRVFPLSTLSAPQSTPAHSLHSLLTPLASSKTMPFCGPHSSALSTKLLNITLSSLCKAKQLPKVESAIIDAIKLGVLPDAVTYNTLIVGYYRFASVDAAHSVLSRMRAAGIPPDVVSYNSLISGAVRQCLLSKSLDLFDEMLARGVAPDTRSYNILMHCLFKLGKPDEANRVFRDVALRDVASAATYNVMINGLCRNGHVAHALSLFRNLRRFGFAPQVLTYNALINGLCRAKRLKAASDVLREFADSGLAPNAVTYTTVMKCCFRCGNFEQGLEILSEMRDLGFTFDGFAYCTVIAAMIKTGRMREANEIIEIMVGSGVRPDLVAYNTLINLYCRQGKLDEALKVVEEIEEEGLVCDKYTHTIIIDGLCKAGDFVGAERHLSYMNGLGFGYNLVAFNCMLDGLGKAGHIDHAVKLFEMMEVKDSFPYTILVHNLCRARRFLCASKVLVSCLKCGYLVLRATQRAVIDGLQSIGFTNEARKVKLRIRLARFVP